MKALLVGGGGFIGSFVAKLLVAEKVETVVLDNFSSEFQQRNLNGATVISGDMLNKETLKSAMRGITHVWHGAYPHNIDSRVDDVDTVWRNIKATAQLAELAKRNKVKKFVYVSSRSVYGRAKYNPIDERHPIQPVTAYGLCKAICEEYLNNILGKSKTKLCTLRGFLVYGPGDRQSVVSKFAQRILKGQPLTVHGDGSATRDFIHVKDMARASVLSLILEDAAGTFNVGSGKETSLLELIEMLTKVAERKDIATNFVHKDDWNINDRCFAEINLARKKLGFKPSVPLEQGLREVLKAFRSSDRIT